MRVPEDKKLRRMALRIFCGLLAALCAFTAAGACFSFIQAELQSQISQSLSDVTSQYTEVVRTELRSKINLIQGISLQMPEDIQEIESRLKLLRKLERLYGFEMAGYITPQGQAYLSDGRQRDLQKDPFWPTVCQGKPTVSYAMEDPDKLGEEINVFTVPVMAQDGQTVRGYLFAAYSAEKIMDLLAIDSFGGDGMSYVLQSDGFIISHSVENSHSVNLFEILNTGLEKDAAALARVKRDLASGGSGFVSYTTDRDYYMYYMPVAIEDAQLSLYIATAVPANVLDQRTAPVVAAARWLLASVVLSILVFLVITIVSYRAQHIQLLTHAYIDPMTGHDNYTAFKIKMQAKRSRGFILAMDLAEFKVINNVCGVSKGDQVIREVWQILAAMLRGDELGCHISADQYALFLTDKTLEDVIQRITEVDKKLQSLSQQLETPRLVGKWGIFEMENSGTPEEGYGKAKLARKTMSRRRDRCYGVYDEEVRQRLIREKWMEDNFESALQNQEFKVWYQPKYSPKTGKITGAEALTRWILPDGTRFVPGEFIPLFERNGMIGRLDEYMFSQTCRASRSWGERGIPIFVNVSRTSLYYGGIVERYRAIAEEMGVPVDAVHLEITESAMINNMVAEEAIRRFHEEGFRIQLDDFGSGYSSLSVLNTQCFDAIKLDKSLVDCIGDRHGESLLYYVISLAHGLDLTVTAEGVEEAYQANLLAELNCDHIQGFYYSRPLPEADFEKLLDLK